MNLLLDAFSKSVERLSNVQISVNSEYDLEEEKIAAQVPMFDIIAQQVAFEFLASEIKTQKLFRKFKFFQNYKMTF